MKRFACFEFLPNYDDPVFNCRIFFCRIFYCDRSTFSRMDYPIPLNVSNDPNGFTHLDQSEINKHTQLGQPFSDYFLKTSSILGPLSKTT